MDARGVVVGARRRAGRGSRGGGRGGVHRQRQRGADRAHVAGRVGRPRGDRMRAIGQCRRRRDAPRAVGRHHCRAQDGRTIHHGNGGTGFRGTRRTGKGRLVVVAGAVGGNCAGHRSNVVRYRHASGCSWRGGVYRQWQGRALGTFVASRVGQRRGDRMRAIGQWRGRRQHAGDRVIGCRHLDAIDVQARRVGQADPDMDARGVVVGARRRAGRGSRGGGRGGVHRQWQGRALGTFVAGRVGQRRGELMHPIAQWRGRRQRAGDRVIGCRHLDAIDVQARRVGQACAHIKARTIVIGDWSGTIRIGDAANIVSISGNSGRSRGRGDIRARGRWGTVTATATADSKCGGASQTEGGQCPDWPRQLGSVMFCLRPVEDIKPIFLGQRGRVSIQANHLAIWRCDIQYSVTINKIIKLDDFFTINF